MSDGRHASPTPSRNSHIVRVELVGKLENDPATGAVRLDTGGWYEHQACSTTATRDTVCVSALAEMPPHGAQDLGQGIWLQGLADSGG